MISGDVKFESELLSDIRELKAKLTSMTAEKDEWKQRHTYLARGSDLLISSLVEARVEAAFLRSAINQAVTDLGTGDMRILPRLEKALQKSSDDLIVAVEHAECAWGDFLKDTEEDQGHHPEWQAASTALEKLKQILWRR